MSTLNVALSAGNAAWKQFKKYRDEKAVEAYDRLATAADSFGGIEGLRERGSELLDESRREAGNVTKAARARLEKALEDAQERGQELSSDARKASLKGRKEAAKVSKRARRKADKRATRAKAKALKAAGRKQRGGNRILVFGLIAALLTALGGAAFWFLRNRKQTPGTTPPAVHEYQLKNAEPEAKLVYSTETPDGEEPAKGKLMSEEELLSSLDDQLAKHEEDDAEGDRTETEIAEAPEEIQGEDLQAEFDRKNDNK